MGEGECKGEGEGEGEGEGKGGGEGDADEGGDEGLGIGEASGGGDAFRREIVGKRLSQPILALPSFQLQYCSEEPNERQYSPSVGTGKWNVYDVKASRKPPWHDKRSTCLKTSASVVCRRAT